MQQCPMKNRRIAQQEVPRAGDQQRRRKAMQISEQRREHRVPAVRLADVFIVTSPIRVLRAMPPEKPFSANICCESPVRLKSASIVNKPRAPGRGSPSCFSFTTTSAVKNPPAEVPNIPMLLGL